MEMLGAGGGFDSKRLRMIGGVVFLLLALVFTFAIPLTIAVEDMDLLVSTGEPNIAPPGQHLDIGRGINAYGQEFVVENDCNVKAVILNIGTLDIAFQDHASFRVGIATTLTMDKEDMITFKDVQAFQMAPGNRTFDLSEVELSAGTTYYLITMISNHWNDTIDVWHYFIENTEADYAGDTYRQSWGYIEFHGTDWVEVTTQTYGAKDVWFELYGLWIDEDENGVPDEDEEEPAWIDNQTAGIMILWVGSIFAGLGGGMLLTQMPEIEQRPWIALVGGMAIFLGWFFMIANPWMLITMVPAIIGR